MKVNYYDKKGSTKGKTYDFKFDFEGEDINETLLNQYLYVYQSNQRQGNAKTKDRSEVRGGGKKPWKQKGTGRARVGSNRSPIWRGGGVTFGPTGEQNYKKKMTKKMRRGAFESAINQLFINEKVSVVEDVTFGKTSEATKLIEKTKLDQRGLLIIHDGGVEFYRPLKNIENLKVVDMNELNVYELLIARNVLILESAAKKLQAKY